MSAAVPPAEASPRRARAAAFLELTKPRLSFLSVLTALAGYAAARPGTELLPFAALVVGTSASAGGAAALNQWLERRVDARMERTRRRPLPAGDLPPGSALAFGTLLAVFGPLVLLAGTTPAAALCAVATLVLYLAAYTPAKRLTPWNTELGAVPGALPPLLGWTAAGGSVADPLAGWLVAVLLAWQIPHFYAIAWLWREDYARAGFAMLPRFDPTGRRTATRAVVGAWVLLVAGLGPVLTRDVAAWAAVPAAIVGGWIVVRAHAFARAEGPGRESAARRLFLATLAHLPVVLAAIAVAV